MRFHWCKQAKLQQPLNSPWKASSARAWTTPKSAIRKRERPDHVRSNSSSSQTSIQSTQVKNRMRRPQWFSQMRKRDHLRMAEDAEMVWVVTIQREPHIRDKYFQVASQTKSDRAQVRIRLGSNQPWRKKECGAHRHGRLRMLKSCGWQQSDESRNLERNTSRQPAKPSQIELKFESDFNQTSPSQSTTLR